MYKNSKQKPAQKNGGRSPSATISDTETVQTHKKYTVYEVSVAFNGHSWKVYKRYNDFLTVYETLKREFPTVNFKFPGKRLFGSNFESTFLRSRKHALDQFVKVIANDAKLVENNEVQEFLELDKMKRQLNSDVIHNDVITRSESSDLATETFSSSLGGSVESGHFSSTSSDTSDYEDLSGKSIDLGPTERKNFSANDFEFLKIVGKGSFGKVILVRRKETNQLFAAKVLSKKLVIGRNESHHVMSERNVLLLQSRVHQHPFLVRLHYSFQTDEKLYFVLDYVNGGELFFHLQKERRFSEARARFYASEIACALGFLHSNGVIYRDLKPENLLLDCEGHVVLTDFGLCKEGLKSAETTTTTFCGTPEYLAPEILRRKPYTIAVDWWCLGIVLYEMLFGLPPFYNKNTNEMYYRIITEPLKFKTTTSSSAKHILEEFLQKEPDRRLGSGPNGFEQIKAHPFFDSVNWNDVVNKRVKPPFKPNVNGMTDLKNIDPEFTKEVISNSISRSRSLSKVVSYVDNGAFQGFSYISSPTVPNQYVSPSIG